MVIWSFPAKEDLKIIHDYIAKDSKVYAKKVVERIVETTEKLNEFPKIGRMVPEIDSHNVRELLIYSYRIIYEIAQNRIEILTIVHSKRDFSSGILN